MTPVSKITRAIAAVEARDEIRGNSYFTGNAFTKEENDVRGADPTKPCCIIGALVLGCDQLHSFIPYLFHENQHTIGNLTVDPSFFKIIEEYYGFIEADLISLQDINDTAPDAGRKKIILQTLYNLKGREEYNGTKY
jgi:hypothetical protein